MAHARTLAFAAIVGLPTGLALAVLVLVGELSIGAALLAAAAVLAVLAVLVHYHVAALRSAADWIDRLAAAADEAPAKLSRSMVLADLYRAARRLRRHLLEERRDIAAQSARTTSIIDRLPDPLLVIDADRVVAGINQAAKRMLGEAIVGRELALVMRHPDLLGAVDAVRRGDSDWAEVTFRESSPVRRELQARIVALPEPAGDTAALVLALYDLTSIKKAEDMRADFVANVSHELRTPLSTLVGFIETLLGPARDDDEARHRFLKIMDEQAKRMSRLIEDLLSLSHIELHEHTAPRERVHLEQVLENVLNVAQIAAAERGMRFDLDLPDLPPVLGEPDELVQVFQNLVDNAIRYGKAGTAVTLRGRRLNGEVAISVIDQGEGIDREHIPRLTERFYRVDKARSRELGGTGLGLAIVKHIVNRHRGGLQIESEPGRGSTFTVRLPSAAAFGDEEKRSAIVDRQKTVTKP